MKEYTITDWNDFWDIFDKLIDLLMSENKVDVAFDFKNAQKCVNGLTDGWYDFMIAFDRTLNSNKERITDEEWNIVNLLRNCLNSKFR